MKTGEIHTGTLLQREHTRKIASKARDSTVRQNTNTGSKNSNHT